MTSEAILRKAIEAALAKSSHEAAAIFIPPENSRQYACKVPGCTRPAYAGEMCNAHYIRARKGRSLSVPVRARKREDRCALCGKKTGAKGGWGLCARHYRARRYAVMKDAVIAAMGGKCAGCGGVFQRAVFDFHHKSGKMDAPSSVLVNCSVEDAAKELAKCELLCANCHRVEHSNESLPAFHP